MAPLLQIEGLRAGFGPIEVLHGVDLVVPEGSVVGLLGANGVGKTTMLRTIAGQMHPTGGRVLFAGDRIEGRRPWEITRLGVTLIPQGRGIFPSLSVADTLRLMAETAGASAESVDDVLDLFPTLAERASQLAGTLSGGEQQMLAMSRAFLARPRLLLVDELSTGLAPVIVEQLYERLADLRDAGVTILLVEQYLAYVLELADLCYVMAKGEMTFVGEPGELDHVDAVGSVQ